MRATLWIAASGLLLASTSAFAVSVERPANDEGAAYVQESVAAPDVSKAQPEEPSSQAQAGTVRTMSPDDPEWDQVHQGG